MLYAAEIPDIQQTIILGTLIYLFSQKYQINAVGTKMATEIISLKDISFSIYSIDASEYSEYPNTFRGMNIMDKRNNPFIIHLPFIEDLQRRYREYMYSFIL